jgi:hypothetical protein
VVKSDNLHDETPHIVEHLDNRIWILFMRESTSGVADGQTTASGSEKAEKSA